MIQGLKVGDKIKGKVNRITPFGAFVKIKLEDNRDIDALVHISEISSKHLADPREVLKIGDEKEFKILTIEPDQHRLSLSLKALEEKFGDEDAKKATPPGRGVPPTIDSSDISGGKKKVSKEVAAEELGKEETPAKKQKDVGEKKATASGEKKKTKAEVKKPAVKKAKKQF